jgi:hypothetical protein
VDDHLHFVQVAFREQRADRTVDQARGQGFLFGRLAFTLEETARDFAGSIGLLDVVDGQREEVLAGLGFLRATTVARTTVSSIDTTRRRKPGERFRRFPGSLDADRTGRSW